MCFYNFTCTNYIVELCIEINLIKKKNFSLFFSLSPSFTKIVSLFCESCWSRIPLYHLTLYYKPLTYMRQRSHVKITFARPETRAGELSVQISGRKYRDGLNRAWPRMNSRFTQSESAKCTRIAVL